MRVARSRRGSEGTVPPISITSSAPLSSFEVSTLEMWPDYMYQSIDAVGPGEAPRRDHNP